jgi:predicted GNAT family acetyltransferase
MATLADLLRGGYTPPTTSALADPIKEHFRNLPQTLETNQRAMDKTMAGMDKTDIMGRPNPNYYPEAMGEFTQNYMPIAGTVKNVAKSLQDKGLILDVYESAKTPLITLSRIQVPKQMRGTGMGTEAMNELSQYADETGKMVALSPSKDFGASSVDRLKDFYKRFGFIENKGKNKDFSISESMYRLPTQTTRKELIQQQIDKIE